MLWKKIVPLALCLGGLWACGGGGEPVLMQSKSHTESLTAPELADSPTASAEDAPEGELHVPATMPEPAGDEGEDAPEELVTGATPDGGSCRRGSDCQSGVCEGLGCDGEAQCAPRMRPCTMDLRAYCGCDGQSFQSSGSCAGQPYRAKGWCEDSP